MGDKTSTGQKTIKNVVVMSEEDSSEVAEIYTKKGKVVDLI